jgi:hypothetical protein
MRLPDEQALLDVPSGPCLHRRVKELASAN